MRRGRHVTNTRRVGDDNARPVSRIRPISPAQSVATSRRSVPASSPALVPQPGRERPPSAARRTLRAATRRVAHVPAAAGPRALESALHVGGTAPAIAPQRSR